MKTINIITSSLSLLSLVSCSIDKIDQGISNNRLVEFSSSKEIIISKETKDLGNYWHGNERVGIYMLKNTTVIIAEAAANIEYTAGNYGTNTNLVSKTPIYYPMSPTDKVAFVSYGPYQSNITNLNYKIDLKDQSNLQALDLIVAYNDNETKGFDKNNKSPVNLEFEHKLTKVYVYLKAGDGVKFTNLIAVKFKNMYAEADYNMYNQTITKRSKKMDIIPFNYKDKNDVSTSSFEAVFLPTLINEENTVEFLVGGDTYTWIMFNNIGKELLPGTEYVYTIVLNKKGIEVTGTIKSWDIVEGTGTAN